MKSNDSEQMMRVATFGPDIFRPAPSTAEDSTMHRSSYMCPEGVQRRLKMLAAARGVKLNDLMIEAMRDVLSKYGM